MVRNPLNCTRFPLGHNKKPESFSKDIEKHSGYKIYRNHRQQLDCRAPTLAEFRLDPLRHQLSLVLPL